MRGRQCWSLAARDAELKEKEEEDVEGRNWRTQVVKVVGGVGSVNGREREGEKR
jgi:hypothetical protein